MDGDNVAFWIKGRADAYQEEAGGAEIALTRHTDDVLWWGCDTKALLQGLQASHYSCLVRPERIRA
eukprot:3786497-Rhodomonas_salina.1